MTPLQSLDRQGMDLIESLDPAGFSAYLKKLGNTICGRHPIGQCRKYLWWLSSLDNTICSRPPIGQCRKHFIFSHWSTQSVAALPSHWSV